MRTPLFVWLRFADGHPNVPNELRYSKILSFQFLAGRPCGVGNLFFWQPIDGVQRIEAIVQRVLRDRGQVRFQEVAEIRGKVAASIYESSSQISMYRNRHVADWRSGCFVGAHENHPGIGQRLYAAGDTESRYMPVIDIPIKPAPKKPCAWCGRLIFPRESWSGSKIHCNSRECRRIHYLQHIPQSRGGIDLTPAQRKATQREAWDTQKTINYLAMRSKEIKRANRASNDIR